MARMRHEGFEVVPDWEQVPDGIRHLDVADVAVDSADNVYLLARQDPQVLVYDRRGAFLRAWGADQFSAQPHGITIDSRDVVYVVDEARCSVETFHLDGTFLGALGPSETPSDTGADPSIPDIYDRIGSIRRGAGPYNRPTKVAVAANGDRYVTDGYGNARVHRFDASGRLVGSWGEPGVGPGQFHLPHYVAVVPDGRVLVCDRENDRIQVFTPDGTHLETRDGLHRPGAIVERHGLLYITEMGWKQGNRTWRHGIAHEPVAARLLVTDLDGRVVVRWGSERPGTPDGLTAPHGIAVDSHGDVYVAEVTWTSDGKGKGNRFPPDAHSFVKLRAAR